MAGGPNTEGRIARSQKTEQKAKRLQQKGFHEGKINANTMSVIQPMIIVRTATYDIYL